MSNTAPNEDAILDLIDELWEIPGLVTEIRQKLGEGDYTGTALRKIAEFCLFQRDIERDLVVEYLRDVKLPLTAELIELGTHRQ